MLLYNALTSVVLGAARLDPPRDAPPRAAEPKPFRLSHNPVPPAAPWAETPLSTPVTVPARPFGRVLVGE